MRPVGCNISNWFQQSLINRRTRIMFTAIYPALFLLWVFPRHQLESESIVKVKGDIFVIHPNRIPPSSHRLDTAAAKIVCMTQKYCSGELLPSVSILSLAVVCYSLYDMWSHSTAYLRQWTSLILTQIMCYHLFVNFCSWIATWKRILGKFK